MSVLNDPFAKSRSRGGGGRGEETGRNDESPSIRTRKPNESFDDAERRERTRTLQYLLSNRVDEKRRPDI
jgi:hypothetical protein